MIVNENNTVEEVVIDAPKMPLKETEQVDVSEPKVTDPDPPNKQKVYDYYVSLYQQSGVSYSEERIKNISGAKNTRNWVDKIRKENNLKPISDSEYNSLYSTWVDSAEVEKKNQNQTFQQGVQKNAIIVQDGDLDSPSILENIPTSSELLEDVDTPGEALKRNPTYYTDRLDNQVSILPALRNLPSDFLSMEEEEAAILFNLRLKKFGYDAEQTGRGNALKITRPDGSPMEIQLMSGAAYDPMVNMSGLSGEDVPFKGSDVYDQRMGIKHNQFILSLASGSSSLVPTISSEFSSYPDRIPETAEGYAKAMNIPSKEDLDYLSLVTTGASNSEMYMSGGEFNEALFMLNLKAVKNRLQPLYNEQERTYNEAVKSAVLQSVKTDNLRMPERGDGLSEEERNKQTKIRDTYEQLDKILKHHQERQYRTSRLIGAALKNSGVSIDLNNKEQVESIISKGLRPEDMPLDALSINGERASFNDVYDLISDVVELRYVRNGEIDIKIDQDADSGMFQEYVDMLVEKRERNNAFLEDNSGVKQFFRGLGDVPQGLYVHTMDLLNDFGHALKDGLELLQVPEEVANHLIFGTHGVYTGGPGRGISTINLSFPDDKKIEELKKMLPQYDRAISDSRDAGEFLAIGMDGFTQSMPYTAAFLANPSLGLVTTAAGTYGSEISYIKDARKAAQEAKASGAILTEREKELLDLNNIEARLYAAGKSGIETGLTAAFTGKYFKQLHLAKGIKGIPKTKEGSRQLADAFARRHRKGLIATFARYTGLDPQVIAKELPEEQLIAAFTYMTDVVFGLEEYDSKKLGKLVVDSGLNSFFTSIPMGVGGKIIGPNVNKVTDAFIQRKMTVEGEMEAVREKLGLDNAVQTLEKKGLDSNSPEMSLALDLQSKANDKLNFINERKKKLVSSMTKADKQSFLEGIARLDEFKATITSGNTPETINGALKEMEIEKARISKLLSKYPSELSYFFLPESEQKALRDRAMKEIEQEKIAEAEAQGGDYTINISELDADVIERASKLYVDDVNQAKAEPSEQFKIGGYFIESPSQYYTETTAQEAADFDIESAIAEIESDLFNQPPAPKKPKEPTLFQPEQTSTTETTETTAEGKTTADFVNRGGRYTDPVTGDILDGDFYVDGQTLVFEEKGTGKVFDIGNASDLSTTPAEDVGIVYLDEKVSVKEDGTMLYDGKEYLIQTDLPTQGVVFDADGRVLSVSVKEKDSDKRIELKGQDAQDAALKIYLSQGEQLPDIEQKLEENEEFQNEKRKPSKKDAKGETDKDTASDTPQEITLEDEIQRRNNLINRIKELNISNNFYQNLAPPKKEGEEASLEQRIIKDFFDDIKNGRTPKFARVENIVRSHEIAYRLSALNDKGIRVFEPSERIQKINKFYDIFNPLWYTKNKVNPFELLGDIYPLLNNEGRKMMTGMRPKTGFTSNQMTSDVLLGAIFRNTRNGQPMIDLVNEGNRKVAESMNAAQEFLDEDLALFKADVREYNKTVPKSQRIPTNLLEVETKLGFIPTGLTDTQLSVDYEMQVLAHLRRLSGETDQLSGMDTEFMRQKNSLLKELQLRKEEFENNKDDVSKTRYEVLKNTLDRLGVADANSFSDVSSNARMPILNALDRLAARFPHDDAMKRKIDYDGSGVFFQKGSYVPSFRTTNDGATTTDGSRNNASSYNKMAGLLQDVTDDSELLNSRLSFGNYFKRSYGQLRGAMIDINGRQDFETLNAMVNSNVFKGMFEDDAEYEMVKKYFGTRLEVFNGLITQGQNAQYDYGDFFGKNYQKALQAAYSGISALGLARLNQPISQYYSALSGTAPMLTDPRAKQHLRNGGFRFLVGMAETGNGQKVSSGLFRQKMGNLVGGGRLSNIYAKSRTGLRNALKAEFAIDDNKTMPISYYASRFNIDETRLRNAAGNRARYTIGGIFDAINKNAELSLEFLLANADRAAANLSFEAHYLQHRIDQGAIIPKGAKSLDAWWARENENPNIEAINYADRRVAETMRQTEPTSEAEFYSKDASTRTKTAQRTLFAWGKFSMNAKANFANQYARTQDPNLPEVEKEEARKRMRGIMSEVATFNGIKNASNYVLFTGLTTSYFMLMGGDEDDVRRYGGITQLLSDAILPVESREYKELLETLPRNQAETLEQFQLSLQESASGIDTTMLELYKYAYEFENKNTLGEMPDVLTRMMVDAAFTAEPFPMGDIIKDMTGLVLNQIYGDEVVPDYISRDLNAIKDTDGLILALTENAGMFSVGMEQVDKLIKVIRLHNDRTFNKGVRSVGSGEIVEYVTAPNDIMQQKLDAALNVLYWGRTLNVLVPGPKGDFNKVLNKLERQIEEKFTTGAPTMKGANSEFIKHYMDYMTKNKGLQIDPYNFESWWNKEKNSMDSDARNFAIDKIEELRRARIYGEK